jgi:PilZ domain
MGNSQVLADDRVSGQEKTNDAAMPERRSSRRRKVLKAAFITSFGGWLKVPCIVRDQSEDGARLIFEPGHLVPRKFTLHIEIDGMKVDCERVWNSGSAHGVRFTGAKEPSAAVRRQFVMCC